jgi:catechol 2,3-dioxygenase-like lactoylglutathione lyase family enzyme
LSAAPILSATDIVETIAFYEGVLGFQTVRNESGYAILGRDSALIHFRYPAQPLPEGAKEIREIYIQVTGIDSLWERARPFKDRYKMRDLFEQPYGMTEFHVIDPNGILIFVGEPTANIADQK